MRALTFNVWHGLAGHGIARFADLEPRGRRDRRYRLQEETLAESGFDVVFLQELNPVDERAASFARRLGMDQCHCIDQSGVKLFGLGLPTNLLSGLGILARPELRLRSLGGLELSGNPLEFVSPIASFQLREHRMSLFAEATSPAHGRLLLVNAHLHHGIEPSPEFDAVLRKAEAAGQLSALERAQLERTMLQADERRAREAARLLERIERLAHGCDGVLIGGDLNSTSRGTAYRLLVDAGFVDVYGATHGDLERAPVDAGAARALAAEHGTWNSERNADNRLYSQGFSLPIADFGRPAVQALHKAYDLRPRRIDFLLARGSLARAEASGLWAETPVAEPARAGAAYAPKKGAAASDDASDGKPGPMFLSDHFGVWAEWTRSGQTP